MLILSVVLLFIYPVYIALKTDGKYIDCMELKAQLVCSRQNLSVAMVDVWRPHVICRDFDKLSNDTYALAWINEMVYPKLIYIFNESEIMDCK